MLFQVFCRILLPNHPITLNRLSSVVWNRILSIYNNIKNIVFESRVDSTVIGISSRGLKNLWSVPRGFRSWTNEPQLYPRKAHRFYPCSTIRGEGKEWKVTSTFGHRVNGDETIKGCYICWAARLATRNTVSLLRYLSEL